MEKHPVVNTLEEYKNLCKKLSKNSDSLFRGQIKNYPQVIASYYARGMGASNSYEPGDIAKIRNLTHKLIIQLYIDSYRIGNSEEIYQNYLDYLNEQYDVASSFGSFPLGSLNWDYTQDYEFEIPPGFNINFSPQEFYRYLTNSIELNWDEHGEAFFQHYGVPSKALDISFNPLIALYFATHQFGKDKKSQVRYTNIKDIENNSLEPVVYVFNSSKVKLIDLRKTHPNMNLSKKDIAYFGLRGIVQEGGLIFGDFLDLEERKDKEGQVVKDKEGHAIMVENLRKYVAHEIPINPSIWEESILGKTYNQSTLFPSPREDDFYKILLDRCNNKDSEFYIFKEHIPLYS